MKKKKKDMLGNAGYLKKSTILNSLITIF